MRGNRLPPKRPSMSDILTGPAMTAEQVSQVTRETNYGTWRFQKT